MSLNGLLGGAQNPTNRVFKPSSYKFTETLRVFKANDPYFYVVDNLPLKQIEENLLWLRDQISTETDLSGIGRADLNELQPYVTGEDRQVFVRPGRYTARINDARNKGIQSLVKDAEGSVANSRLHPNITFELSDEVIKTIISSETSALMLNNGLYDFLQHHHVHSTDNEESTEWDTGPGTFTQNELEGQGILNIPKNKLALWKQDSTSRNYTSDAVDLAQLATEFTRKWGGVFRTAIVNIPETLSVTVPPFIDNDFINNSTSVPAIRIDLVFIYSHPIDSSSTTITKPNGTSPTTITAPQLGVLKGAGVVALNGKGVTFNGLDINNDPTILDSIIWDEGRENPGNYFQASGGVDDDGNYQIQAPLADQLQSEAGLGNVFGNFPSPDDLLNLAPLLIDDLAANSDFLVGQSILPLAYIVVKREVSTLATTDLIDIRPFFRTTELTYNERAGIAGAYPPLSLANPAVGKAEVFEFGRKLKNHVIAQLPSVPQYPRPVGAGMIFGGLLYGVEGALARLASSNRASNPLPSNDPTNAANLLQWFKDNGAVPQTTAGIPSLPDWDLAFWANSKPDPGEKRNDWINYARQFGTEQTYKFDNDDTYEGIVWDRVQQPIAHQESFKVGSIYYFVKKRINLDKSQVSWMAHYDVEIEYINCVPASQQDMMVTNGRDQSIWKQFAGLYVEKYPNYFEVIAAWAAVDPWSAPDERDHAEVPSNDGNNGRTSGLWSSFMVTHTDTRFAQSQTVGGSPEPGGNPTLIVTYPTVSFRVVGYPADFTVRTDLNNSNPTLVLRS